jgi:hypothetical protein
MNRLSANGVFDIGATLGASDVIKFGEFTMGEYHIPSTASSLTTITWYSCATEDGTYLAAYDGDGVAVTQTVSASKAYPIPAALAGACFIKAVGNVAQASTAFVLKA